MRINAATFDGNRILSPVAKFEKNPPSVRFMFYNIFFAARIHANNHYFYTPNEAVTGFNY
jgi:hypothetical protein